MQINSVRLNKTVNPSVNPIAFGLHHSSSPDDSKPSNSSSTQVKSPWTDLMMGLIQNSFEGIPLGSKEYMAQTNSVKLSILMAHTSKCINNFEAFIGDLHAFVDDIPSFLVKSLKTLPNQPPINSSSEPLIDRIKVLNTQLKEFSDLSEILHEELNKLEKMNSQDLNKEKNTWQYRLYQKISNSNWLKRVLQPTLLKQGKSLEEALVDADHMMKNSEFLPILRILEPVVRRVNGADEVHSNINRLKRQMDKYKQAVCKAQTELSRLSQYVEILNRRYLNLKK